MTLLYKIKRLIKADAHALLDGLEEPKWILQQAIRDMDEDLQKLSCQREDIKRRLDQLDQQIQFQNKEMKSTEEDINLSMEEKREDIAKALIKKLLLKQKNQEQLNEQKSLLEKKGEDLDAEMTSKKERFDDISQRAQGMVFSEKSDVIFDEGQKTALTSSTLQHEVEIEFLRRLKKGKGGHDAH